MRSALVAAFLLSVAFSAQLNYLAGGAPVALERAGTRYVAATPNTLYVFSDTGELEGYLSLNGISDFAVSGDVLVVTLTSQSFPNVRAYSFPGLVPMWTFEPELDVFDPSLVWTRKQTRSWAVKPVQGDFGVASGYTLYVLSPSGDLLGNFTTGSDVWDFHWGDDVLLATQEGALYVFGRDAELKERRELCDPYTLIDRVSNSTVGTYTRSVWSVDGRVAVCEDGTVHPVAGGAPEQLKRYTDSQLYSQYYQNRRETGYGSQSFRNVRLATGDVSVAYTDGKMAVFDGSDLLWEKEVSVADVSVSDGEVYVLSVDRLGVETVKVYDAQDGALDRSFQTEGIACAGVRELLVGEDGLLVASQCEIKKVSPTGAVEWYLPLSTDADFVEGSGLRVFFTDKGENQYNRPEFYSMFAMEDGELKWQYSLPGAMSQDGHLAGAYVVGDGRVVAHYDSDEGDRLVVIERNGTSRVLNATDRVFAGDLDRYLLNSSIRQFIQNYSYGSFDAIPEEFKFGGDTDPDRWGESNVLLWLEMLRRLPVSPEVMDGLRNVVQETGNYVLDREIRSVDTCDYDGDGYQDLLVVADSYLVVRDGLTMEELLFKDREVWRYDNTRINQPLRANLTAPWWQGGSARCVEDINGDGTAELLVASWEGNVSLLFSHDGNHSARWHTYYKNLHSDWVRDIGDVDGDGHQDVLVTSWVEDRPNNLFILSSRDGGVRFTATPHQYSLRTSIGDVDGDGLNESLLAYDYDGAVLAVFSPTYKFEYTELQDFWSVFDKYGQVLPAAVVPDTDGDGYNEIVVGAARRWGDPGAALLFFSGDTGEVIGRVALVGDDSRVSPDEWVLVPDLRRFGDRLVVVVPAQEDQSSGSGQLVVYDLATGNVESYVNREARKVVGYGDGLEFVGTSGEVFAMGASSVGEPAVSTEGPELHVESSPDYYTSVYVDGSVAASGREDSFNARLSNGDHRVVVSLATEDGLERLFTSEQTTFTSSNLQFLNTLIIVAAAAFGGFKVVKKWKKR